MWCFAIFVLSISSIGLFAVNQDLTKEKLEVATFAGGCFWCMETPFEELDGVVETIVGYTGGDHPNPTYEEVSSGKTGHAESIQVTYDPAKISYEDLLAVFWKNIDPSAKNRQFCDVGTQYRSAIFYHNDHQKALAEASKQNLVDSGRFEQVYTEVVPATSFFRAEEYHQDYHRKQPLKYWTYKTLCGRDQRLKQIWESP